MNGISSMLPSNFKTIKPGGNIALGYLENSLFIAYKDIFDPRSIDGIEIRESYKKFYEEFKIGVGYSYSSGCLIIRLKCNYQEAINIVEDYLKTENFFLEEE